MTLSAYLMQATQFLSPSDTARLDAEVLLAAVLQTSRSSLIAHDERILTIEEQEHYQHFLARRKQGEPIAYLLGHKEFWSLDFCLTPAVLIPRPETELLVELLLQFFPETQGYRRIADLGAGAGTIAVSVAKERPAWDIYATDVSSEALQLAVHNAKCLGVSKIHFSQGTWCQALPSLLFDVIVSNPPYLSQAEWVTGAKELHFEPASALVGGKDGLEDLQKIVQCAKHYLMPGGYLLLEHGSTQAAAIRQLFIAEKYVEVRSYCDLAGIERATKGQFL